MKDNLIATLKAWPIITIVTIGLCYLTTFIADVAFGINLDPQTSVAQIKDTITALVKHMCGGAGPRWYFLKDLVSLTQIILTLTVLVPILEEVVFRWILWRLPKPALPIVSALTSSALFSAAHYLQMPWPNNAFIALFFFGMAQCWLYKKTDALWCPIVNHGLFNATTIALMFVIP